MQCLLAAGRGDVVSNDDDDTPAAGRLRIFHMKGSFLERGGQEGSVAENAGGCCFLNFLSRQRAVPGKVLRQTSSFRERHDGHLIVRLETMQSVESAVANLMNDGPGAATNVKQKNDSQRQFVATEIIDLLADTVIGKFEIVLS